MTAVTLVIVLVSQQAYWFGGDEGTIEVRWSAEAEMPQAELEWELMHGTVRLAEGTLEMNADEAPARVTLQPPEVRARTTLRWVWRVRDPENGEEIASGEESIHLFPRNLLENLPRRMEDRTLVVWDDPEALPALLEEAEIPHRTIERPVQLRSGAVEILLIGADQLDESPFSQSMLVDLAREGTSVMVFAQRAPRRLAEYGLIDRTPPAALAWRIDHLLLARFEVTDLNSWLAATPESVRAIELPADEPALEIGWWPREAPGVEPAPIDALLVSKTIGRGRIVLCQIPLGDWQADPRSQLLLANALDYLSSRPGPTPRPSQREDVKVIEIETPRIAVPPGDRP